MCNPKPSPRGMKFFHVLPEGPRETAQTLQEDVDSWGECYWFWCEGCGTHHSFRTKLSASELMRAHRGEKIALWTFNGNLEQPTFRPSLLYPGWKNSKGEAKGRCHLFVENGMVRYLKDCHHRLAGQIVPLQPPK